MASQHLSKEEKKQRRKRANRIAAIALLILILLGVLIVHPLMIRRYRKLLTEKGYCNPVSVGDHALNLVECGKDPGRFTIVVLSGFGVGDSCISMRKMTAGLEAHNRVIFLDRAGYGASDDAKNGMDVDTIVEEYRAALKAAGVSASYTLMAHSIAGVYASYWVSKYPQEINNMVFLDSTWVTDENANDPVTPIILSQGAMYLAAKIGAADLAPSTFDGTKEERALSKALFSMTSDSGALISEAKCQPANIQATLDILKPTIPSKLYICAGGDDLPEESQNTLKRYTEQLGNCLIENIDCGHFVYLEKPEECCRIIKSYLDRFWDE